MRLATWGLVLLPVFVLGSLLQEEIAEQRGRSQGTVDAQRDIEEGKLALKGSGKPMYWDRDYKSILAERFGIEYEHVAGCVPSPYQRGYIFSYKEVVKPFLDEREINFDQLVSEAKSQADARMHFQ